MCDILQQYKIVFSDALYHVQGFCFFYIKSKCVVSSLRDFRDDLVEAFYFAAEEQWDALVVIPESKGSDPVPVFPL